jgi:MFS family permease
MLKKINKVIRILIFSDFLFTSGWGLISPIFAIFLIEDINGSGAMVAGFAAAIYWLVKSILQPFIAYYLDKHHGEKDDLYFLIGGYILVSFVPLGYIFSYLPWHIYLLQFLYAIGMACAIPTWAGIFTRHIDKGKEAFEWSIESTSLGIAAGITGAVGGLVGSIVGFKILFLAVSIFTLGAGFVLFFILNNIYQRDGHLIRPIGETKEQT